MKTRKIKKIRAKIITSAYISISNRAF